MPSFRFPFLLVAFALASAVASAQADVGVGAEALEATATEVTFRIEMAFTSTHERATLVLRPSLPATASVPQMVDALGDTLWSGAATAGETVSWTARVPAEMSEPRLALATVRFPSGRGGLGLTYYTHAAGRLIEASSLIGLYRLEVEALVEQAGLTGAPAATLAAEAPLLHWRTENGYRRPTVELAHVGLADGRLVPYLRVPPGLRSDLPGLEEAIGLAVEAADLGVPTITLKPGAGEVPIPEALYYKPDGSRSASDQQRAYAAWAARLQAWYRVQGLLRE